MGYAAFELLRTSPAQLPRYIPGGAHEVGRFYGSDPLGSTVALYDTSGNKTDEYVYWPYGEIRSHTGSSQTPLTFLGTLGYYMDSPARYYVRARMLLANYARWLTVDPLWPRQRAYPYARSRPTSLVDARGLAPSALCLIPCAPCIACLADTLIVCPPGPGFFQCVEDVWNNLPIWAKKLCLLACGGCIACLASPEVGPLPTPAPLPIPEPEPPLGPFPPEPIPGNPDAPPCPPQNCYAICMGIWSLSVCAGKPNYNVCVEQGMYFCRSYCGMPPWPFPGGGGGGGGTPVPVEGGGGLPIAA